MNVELATALIWIRPHPDHNDPVRWAVQVDGQDPFVCEIRQNRPTCVGFAVRRDANCTFGLDFRCDYEVTDSGADKRELSFVLTELAFCPDDAQAIIGDQSESPRFAGFSWTDELSLQGRLLDVPAGTLVESFSNGEKAAEALTDASGTFSLPLGSVVGHSAQTLNIVAQGTSIEIDLVVDPVAAGGERTDLRLPETRSSLEYCSGQQPVLVEKAGNPAVPAVAAAVPFGPLLETLAVQTEALRVLLSRTEPVAPAAVDSPLHNEPLLPSDTFERYGSLFDMAVNYRGAGHDIIFLSVIDWNFRIQRPQHLAADLARRGNRVFYISIVFEPLDSRGRFKILQSPELGVYEVRLKLGGALPPNIYRRLDPEIVGEILAALDEMISVLSISAPKVVVQYPSWAPVAFGIPGATVVHDCLDLVSGFEDTPREIVELEHQLVESADLLVTTSNPLRDLLADKRSSVVIRNGADVELFAAAAERPGQSPYAGKVVGYFGAIAHWFNVEWISAAAQAHPEWTIVLIGDATSAHIHTLAKYPNVVLLGERPYLELVEHLAYFDVAVIPFKLLDLIVCTNPVKLYEYMAAGKAVVASAMPEAVQATELVYIAADQKDFVTKIETALLEDSDDLRKERMAWAKQHSWASRADAFSALLDTADPKVSVVVLSYKNWDFTKATLWSIIAFSDYRNLEIIIVDNGSGDEIVSNLKHFAARDSRIKLVLSERNLGYAAGNNLGLREATGEYVILLNNDTYVTRGWVRDLIRPLRLDDSIGLVSPLTNNIGNEQRVTIHYSDMEQMARAARSVIRQHSRERFETECVAFFCAAMRRDVIEKVGLLDESYGLGFFEDDDYCRRTLDAGYRIQIVDDVFVHHHLSASFNQLGQDKKNELMKQNRSIFETRWGPWKPHTHRRAAGFG